MLLRLPGNENRHFLIPGRKVQLIEGASIGKQPSLQTGCAGRTHSRGKQRGCGGSHLDMTHSLTRKIQVSFCRLNHFEGGWVWAFGASVLLTKLRAWCPTVALIIHYTDSKNDSIWSDSTPLGYPLIFGFMSSGFGAMVCLVRGCLCTSHAPEESFHTLTLLCTEATPHLHTHTCSSTHMHTHQ